MHSLDERVGFCETGHKNFKKIVYYYHPKNIRASYTQIMKKLKFLLIILLIFITPMAQSQPPVRKPPAIKGMYYMTIPAGVFLKGIMQSEISTKTNNLNDPIRAIIPTNFYLMNAICIPQNSIIEGEITEFALPKKGRDAIMRLHFNKLTFPDYKSCPIDADLWMDGSNVVGGQPSELSEMREVPFSVGGLSPGYLLMKPTGEYRMGKDMTLSAGSEVIIKINNEIKINFYE